MAADDERDSGGIWVEVFHQQPGSPPANLGFCRFEQLPQIGHSIVIIGVTGQLTVVSVVHYSSETVPRTEIRVQ